MLSDKDAVATVAVKSLERAKNFALRRPRGRRRRRTDGPIARGRLDSGRPAPRHGPEQIRRSPVTFARRGFEPVAVQDSHLSPLIPDQAGFL
jgi:hypothetical protein